MLLISHRGNLEGTDKSIENNPKHIESIIDSYNVEIDLRINNNTLFLGHDYPQYEITEDWILKHSDRLWIHCKDVKSLTFCSNHRELNYFWHENDDYTMTSFGYIWAYPGKEIADNMTVLVLPEIKWNYDEIHQIMPIGICSDYVKVYRL
jgi:hypothetical protein